MIRFILPTIVILLSSSPLCPAQTADELRNQLEDQTKIMGVSHDMIRNDKDEKIEVIKFHTYQDVRERHDYRVRVTAELTDKNDVSGYGQFMRAQGGVPADYTGEDDWTFELEHGSLERAKLSALVIEYGIFHQGTFVPLAVETDHVDDAREITEGGGARLSLKCTRHSVWYQGR